MVSRLLRKEAANLGERNIPRIFIEGVSPVELKVLFWREPAEGNITLEIWGTSNGMFAIFEGNFSDQEWGQQDVQFVTETESIRSAIAYVMSNYLVLENEEPYDQTHTAKIKRLKIKK